MNLTTDKLTPKQAADFLDVGSEVLKKYALLLEHNGHTIGRNSMNHRYYVGEDIALIKAMIILNREKSIPLEEAASIVTSSDTDIEAIIGDPVTHNNGNNEVHSVITVQVTNELQALRTFLERQQQDNATLRSEIQSVLGFQERIEQKLDEQADLITQQNEQIRELKKELHEAKEQPKTIWSRLFGK